MTRRELFSGRVLINHRAVTLRKAAAAVIINLLQLPNRTGAEQIGPEWKTKENPSVFVC